MVSAWYACAGGSRTLWAVDVHRRRAAAGAGDDRDGELAPRVGLAVNRLGGNMHELPRAGVNRSLAAWPEIQSQHPGDHVQAGLMLAMMVPARGGSRLG